LPVIETAAEKWVALTRRIATARLRPEYQDMSLVRHLYDLHRICEKGHFSNEFYQLAPEIVLSDRKHYKNHNNDYYFNPVARGNQVLTKADKMYLDNSTLLAAVNAFLSTDLDIGTQRELFFLQSVSGAGLPVFHPQKGDFFIRDKTFEVGGKNKAISQLKDVDPDRRMLVKDGILAGSKKEIPLYLFGFLY